MVYKKILTSCEGQDLSRVKIPEFDVWNVLVK